MSCFLSLLPRSVMNPRARWRAGGNRSFVSDCLDSPTLTKVECDVERHTASLHWRVTSLAAGKSRLLFQCVPGVRVPVAPLCGVDVDKN